MDYVTVRELREQSAKVWDRIEAGEEIVITRNGKPFALLLHTQPNQVEQALRAHRAARLGAVLDRIHAHVEAQGLDRITAKEIAAEIAASRKQSKRNTQSKPRIARKQAKAADAKPRGR